jgi:hypothetical protein
MTTKTQLINALRTFVSQRSGIDSRNYASSWRDSDGIKALRSDQYTIKKHGTDARDLIRFIELRDSITVDDMLVHFKTGRLSWDDAKKRFDYCTGQYFPTEYRAAVCRALISIVMAWGCDQCNVFGNGTNFLQHQLGRGIAERWHR